MPIQPISGQTRLPIEFLREPDRNFEKGGRSFYFFDLDDNVIHLPTRIFTRCEQTQKEFSHSTADYAKIHHLIGSPDSLDWVNHRVDYDPLEGSFRRFREHPNLSPNDQPIIQDMREALAHPFLEWRGPSWDFFVHAVNNNRPISVITARGHHPHTVRRAIDMLVVSRELEAHPNYLSVYPVNHPDVRGRVLGDPDQSLSTALLKKLAIKRAVQDAMECYGENPHHRFGMSDDDPVNVALIREAMRELKTQYPENAFFVISTFERKIYKEEILLETAEFLEGDGSNSSADDSRQAELLVP